MHKQPAFFLASPTPLDVSVPASQLDTQRTTSYRWHTRRRARIEACAPAVSRIQITPTPKRTSVPSMDIHAAGVMAFDVAVVGAGPSGLALAAALAERGARIALFDPKLDSPWPNHYGVWRDEFEPLGLEDCAVSTYPTTAVCVGDADEKTVMNRPYIRVDRVKLKSRLLERCIANGVHIDSAAVESIEHASSNYSTLTISEAFSTPSTTKMHSQLMDRGARQHGTQSNSVESARLSNAGSEKQIVKARIVVDCTGHALRFTKTVAPSIYIKPMQQAAYGIEADVVSHPYQVDQMLLMDFRDEHMHGNQTDAAKSAARPTFLYVFPSSPTRAFFEETSVIAPEAVPFEELKERLYKRLRHDGVVVSNVVEEEFSLIPMGGTVPDPSQRIVSFGGAACLVHPATGYMVAKTMSLAGEVADVIVSGLHEIGESGDVERVSTAVWNHIWSVRKRRQRDFLNFGAELLGGLGVSASRGFFDAFFRLPDDLWRKFLSAEIDEPAERMYFALYFFAISNNQIRASLLHAMWTIGRWKLIRSVLPVALSDGAD